MVKATMKTSELTPIVWIILLLTAAAYPTIMVGSARPEMMSVKVLGVPLAGLVSIMRNTENMIMSAVKIIRESL